METFDVKILLGVLTPPGSTTLELFCFPCPCEWMYVMETFIIEILGIPLAQFMTLFADLSSSHLSSSHPQPELITRWFPIPWSLQGKKKK